MGVSSPTKRPTPTTQKVPAHLRYAAHAPRAAGAAHGRPRAARGGGVRAADIGGRPACDRARAVTDGRAAVNVQGNDLSYCDEITDAAVIALARACPELSYLNMLGVSVSRALLSEYHFVHSDHTRGIVCGVPSAPSRHYI